MKKILIIVVMFVSLCVADASAQSANRKGWYMDYTVGYGAGEKHYGRGEYYGLELGLGAGYRLKLSTHWAWDFRLNTLLNVDYIEGSQFVAISPLGIRYTSNDFGNGKSIAWGMRIGSGYPEFIHAQTYLDLNLTRKLYLGWYVGVGSDLGFYTEGIHIITGLRLTQRF